MAASLRNADRETRWQDWTTLALAIWLFISPWVLRFGGPRVIGSGAHSAAGGASSGQIDAINAGAWNAWVLGAVVFLIALSILGKASLWQEWVNIVLGVWIFIAPMVLGFTHAAPSAAREHWVLGAVLVAISIWRLAEGRHGTPAAANYVHAGDKPNDVH